MVAIVQVNCLIRTYDPLSWKRQVYIDQNWHYNPSLFCPLVSDLWTVIVHPYCIGWSIFSVCLTRQKNEFDVILDRWLQFINNLIIQDCWTHSESPVMNCTSRLVVGNKVSTLLYFPHSSTLSVRLLARVICSGNVNWKIYLSPWKCTKRPLARETSKLYQEHDNAFG